jgi:hypothetical protein
MRRLSNISESEFMDWAEKKRKVGKEEYGDSHRDRYGLVDFVEEILDAAHILDLYFERLVKENARNFDLIKEEGLNAVENLEELVKSARKMDAMTDDRHCTDGEGGERIWWNESPLRDTIWVRPDTGMQFLVHPFRDLQEAPEWFIDEYFNCDENNAMYFLGTVESALEAGEYSYFNEKPKLKSITLDGKDGEVVEIEYKIIKMTEKELEGVGEFNGW